MASLKFKGIILDLDGVITKTAHIHNWAWKKMFDEFLKKRAEKENKPFRPFTHEDDYLPYVDGKPRSQGVKSFLESRGINLPMGETSDPPAKDTICGLGTRKNLAYQGIIKTEGPEVFSTTIELIKELKELGIRIGVASSSQNCQVIIQIAGIEKLFETRVDGVVSLEMKLKGKPNPDIFVQAASNLGLAPKECIMVEDAVSGVAAGRAGNFGLVLGIARHDNEMDLLSNGADIVVKDMGEITVKNIDDWFKKGIKENSWNLTYFGFDKKNEKLRETLCTVGNGYMGTRGCLEAENASSTHYPGTYLAGVYNKTLTVVHGKNIYNNDLVNCPNWIPLEFKIGNKGYISPLDMEILYYKQNLDMQNGIMERFITCKDSAGRITTIHSKRLSSMHNPHYAAIHYEIIPLNYIEKITIKSSLDGSVLNTGVKRYSDLNTKHLKPVSKGKTDDSLHLAVETSKSKIRIALNAKTLVYEDNSLKYARRAVLEDDAKISEEIEIIAKEGRIYTVEKLVSIYTSLDDNSSTPEEASKEAISRVNSFRDILEPHIKTWHSLWHKADIAIDGDRFVQKTARLHIYHMLTTASIHNNSIDAGMPARGLHGEAYRGHIFWDELFIFPFFNHHFPEITRSMLTYRHKRLGAAKKYAKENGYKGAMYPWQTADDGSEETQVIHYNPVSGGWDPDLSCRQRHVSIAIFYNIWEYCFITNDMDFLYSRGAGMMLEIARFWASIAEYDKQTKKYHIRGVMGPDEFHEKYYGSKESGVTDNAYTNIMVAWLMEKTLMVIDSLPRNIKKKVTEEVKLKPAELTKWNDIAHNINVIINKNGIISQFDGYMNLKELNWEKYRKKYQNIHRIDRILKSEKDTPDKYKVAKQADTLMLFYLLSPLEIGRILKNLGHNLKDYNKLLKDNYDFYVKRTSHGSTLSMIVHADILKYLKDSQTAWDWFMECAKSDIYDTQGGTTIEGIHAGVMAGTLNIIMENFGGISCSYEKLEINPRLPSHWASLTFKFLFKGNWYNIDITRSRIKVSTESEESQAVYSKNKKYNVSKNKPKTITY